MQKKRVGHKQLLLHYYRKWVKKQEKGTVAYHHEAMRPVCVIISYKGEIEDRCCDKGQTGPYRNRLGGVRVQLSNKHEEDD